MRPEESSSPWLPCVPLCTLLTGRRRCKASTPARRVAGIDVHRMLHLVTVVVEQLDGAIEQTSREYGGFRRDCRALAAWLAELHVKLVALAHGLLPTILGINRIAAALILIETRRAGKGVFRYILCECSNAARMTKSTLAAKYRSLTALVRDTHWLPRHADPSSNAAPLWRRHSPQCQ